MLKDDVKQALKELLAESDSVVEKTPAYSHNATVLHGQGGLFSNSLERDVITAHMRPFGIGNHLPLFPSTEEDPRFGSITGFSADIGSEPATVCYDAPTNYIKGCNLTARFGLLRRDTNTIDFDVVPIQQETHCSIERKGTDSELCFVRITQLTNAFNHCDHSVQVWMFNRP